MAWPLRRYFRLLWWILCGLAFIALPLTIWQFQVLQYDIHYQAWFIGGIFVILSIPISIYEIALHTEYYTQPQLQKHVIRILWMVPIYGVDAWFALRFRRVAEYLDPIRECYEAYVIYSFISYLSAFLEDKMRGDVDDYLRGRPPRPHPPPVSWIVRPWPMGQQFLWNCKKGVLNYVILRPICTTLAIITDVFGLYGKGQISFSKSYMYLALVTNFSQLWALYCLVQLYTALHVDLAPIRPLSKFICIKAVVFVTFWQGVAIAILVRAGIITGEDWTPVDKNYLASGIQDFLICIEMFIAAIAHAHAFPPRDYMDEAATTKGFFANVKFMFDLRDVVDEMGMVVEEHVASASNSASSVAMLPKRAVRRAAEGLGIKVSNGSESKPTSPVGSPDVRICPYSKLQQQQQPDTIDIDAVEGGEGSIDLRSSGNNGGEGSGGSGGGGGNGGESLTSLAGRVATKFGSPVTRNGIFGGLLAFASGNRNNVGQFGSEAEKNRLLSEDVDELQDMDDLVAPQLRRISSSSNAVAATTDATPGGNYNSYSGSNGSGGLGLLPSSSAPALSLNSLLREAEANATVGLPPRSHLTSGAIAGGGFSSNPHGDPVTGARSNGPDGKSGGETLVSPNNSNGNSNNYYTNSDNNPVMLGVVNHNNNKSTKNNSSSSNNSSTMIISSIHTKKEMNSSGSNSSFVVAPDDGYLTSSTSSATGGSGNDDRVTSFSGRDSTSSFSSAPPSTAAATTATTTMATAPSFFGKPPSAAPSSSSSTAFVKIPSFKRPSPSFLGNARQYSDAAELDNGGNGDDDEDRSSMNDDVPLVAMSQYGRVSSTSALGSITGSRLFGNSSGAATALHGTRVPLLSADAELKPMGSSSSTTLEREWKGRDL